MQIDRLRINTLSADSLKLCCCATRKKSESEVSQYHIQAAATYSRELRRHILGGNRWKFVVM